MSNQESHRVHRPPPLGRLDRATLLLWRVLNVVGWSVVGAIIAIELHWIAVQLGYFEQTAGFHRAGEFVPELGPGTTARIIGWRLLTAAANGMVIGLIVGKRVWTKRAIVAGFAALGYALFAMVGLEHSAAASAAVVWGVEPAWIEPNGFRRVLLHDAAILSVVPMAAVAARAIDRRRA